MTSILKVATIQKTNGSAPTLADLSISHAGSIIQTVSATSSTGVTVGGGSNGTWTNVNPTIDITPKFASSKILIIHSGSLMSYAQGQSIQMRLIRGNSSIAHYGRMYTDLPNSDWQSWAMTWPYMDSPNTTSSTGYGCQIWMEQSTGELRHNTTVSNTVTATMIAMEIKQ